MSKAGGNIFRRVWNFYYEGFRSMTVGRTLWIIIIVKLAIMFGIFKLFFFPDYLGTQCDTDEQRAELVRHELTNR